MSINVDRLGSDVRQLGDSAEGRDAAVDLVQRGLEWQAAQLAAAAPRAEAVDVESTLLLLDATVSSDEEGEGAGSDAEEGDMQALLSPPVSMSLAVTSRFKLRPYVTLFCAFGLIAFLPSMAITDNLLWLAAPACFVLCTQLASGKSYQAHLDKLERRAMRRSGGAEGAGAARGATTATAAKQPSRGSWTSVINTFKQYSAWRLKLEEEQRQDHLPSWSALALVLGYVWLIVVALLIGLDLKERTFRQCGGLEWDGSYSSCGMSGRGGGVTPQELAHALATNQTHTLPMYLGKVIVQATVSGTFIWEDRFIELLPLSRILRLMVYFYFATCGVVALVLMWGSHSVSQSMVKTKLKSRIRKHAKRTAAAAAAAAAAAGVVAAGAPRTSTASRLAQAAIESRKRQTAKVAPTCHQPNTEQAVLHSISAAGSNSWDSASAAPAAPEAEPAAAGSAATALGEAVGAGEVGVSAAASDGPARVSGVADHAWLRSVADHFHLYGLLYLLDTRNDSVTGLEEMLQDESLAHLERSTIARHSGSAAAVAMASCAPVPSGSSPSLAAAAALDPSDGPFSVLLRDSFLRQYLILLEATGQLLFTSKLWGHPQLDRLFLSAAQNERATKLRIYKPQKKSRRKKDEEAAAADSDEEDDEEDEGAVALQAATSSTRIRRWAGTWWGNGHRGPAASSSPSSAPVGAPVASAPPAASYWKLVCLLISLLVSSWLPLVTWINYTSYMHALDHFLLAVLIPYIAIFTYLVGRVLQYPYLCYRQNWMAMMVLYHTKLKLTRSRDLKVWRDLRHYLVLYRMPVLFGLAQWSLMAMLLTAVIGLLLCTISVWQIGFMVFIVWFGNQAVLLMTVVCLSFSWAMLEAAVEVWYKQQSHIRLLQDQKFAILLRQKRRNREGLLKQIDSEAQPKSTAPAAGEAPPTAFPATGSDRRAGAAAAVAAPSAAAAPSSSASPSSPSPPSALSSVEERLVVEGVNELIGYIADHDQAPQAFGLDIKPTLFRMLQGYMVTAAISWLAKYGASTI